MRLIKYIPLVVVLVVVGFLIFARPDSSVGAIQLDPQTAQKVEWTKPTTNAEWAEDTKKEQLHLKFDDQLQQMKESHERKFLEHATPEYEKATQFPDAIRWEVIQEFEDNEEYQNAKNQKQRDDLVNVEVQSRIDAAVWDYEKLAQSVERINNEIRLRKNGYLNITDRLPPTDPQREVIDGPGSKTRSPLGTAYYLDFVNGDDTAAGTATTTAWQSLDKFAENARSAGDIAFVRRGVASTTNITDVSLLSDGTSINPIVMTADYDDLWGDFATSSQTYTPTWGSKTMTASASITGIAANDWIYVAGDCSETFSASTFNDCEFAYEVESVSGTTLTLYLPYKGDQTGAGNSLRVMPDAPQWGAASNTTGSISIGGDNHWAFKGLDLRSSDSGGIIDSSTVLGTEFTDTIFQSDGGGDNWYDESLAAFVSFRKIRVFDADFTFSPRGGLVIIEDGLNDLNSDFSNVAFKPGTSGTLQLVVSDFEIINPGVSSDVFEQVGQTFLSSTFRNITYDTSLNFISYVSTITQMNSRVSVEDFNGVAGDNRVFTLLHTTDVSGTSFGELQSTTTVTRSGGGPVSLTVRPTVWVSDSDSGKLELFDYPVYADTTSKTYQVFFKGGTTTPEFTASPTADELWIECDYYRSSSNAHRGVTKSTGTVDFTTDADFDQSLSVTCAPSQTGLLYLRGWYTKPKEAEFDNMFFVDPTPVIQ